MIHHPRRKHTADLILLHGTQTNSLETKILADFMVFDLPENDE